MMNGRMVTNCLMDRGALDDIASVQTQEKGREKKESSSTMRGRMVTNCLMDRGALDDVASVQTQEKGREKQG